MNGEVFKIKKAWSEVPVLGNLWVIALYNSPGRDSNLSEISETETRNVSSCGGFNAPNQELNSTYNSDNGEKVLETAETGTFKLLNNDFHTYRSRQEDCRNTLDLHFTDQSVFKFFDIFCFRRLW